MANNYKISTVKNRSLATNLVPLHEYRFKVQRDINSIAEEIEPTLS